MGSKKRSLAEMKATKSTPTKLRAMRDSLPSMEIEITNSALDKPHQLLLLLALSLFLMVARYSTEPAPTPDYSKNWLTIADIIVSGGDPYVDWWDNKSPIWQYLNALLYLTGHPYAAFLALIVAVNSFSAYLLGALSDRINLTNTRLVPAVAYLLILAVADGFTINSRQFATLCLLLACFQRTPIRIGAIMALSTLFHQYYGLLIPVVLGYHYAFTDRDLDARWLATFATTGVATAVVSYISLAVIWGRDVLVTALRYSVLGIIGFIDRGRATGDAVFRQPVYWIKSVVDPIQSSPGVLIIVGASAFGLWKLSLIPNRRQEFVWLSSFLALSTIPLLIDPVIYYWIAPAAPLALVFGYAVDLME